MKYRVVYLEGETYQVVDVEEGIVFFQGTLSDCEAWINLHKKGYM